MSDISKINNSLELTKKMLSENLEQISNICSVSSQLAKSVELINQTLHQPLLDLQQQISDMILPQLSFSVQMQDWLNNLMAPIRETLETWNTDVISDFNNSLSVDNAFTEQINLIHEYMDSLASSFKGITIHENYVSFPDALIPEDYACDEIPEPPDISSESAKIDAPIKRLSYSDALAIIGILIQLVCWIISFIQVNQSSLQEQQKHQELVALQEESNRIQEERNQILQQQLDSAEKQKDYLLAIYNTILQSDSASSDTEPCPQYDSSQSQIVESVLPTEADDFHDIDTPQQLD